MGDIYQAEEPSRWDENRDASAKCQCQLYGNGYWTGCKNFSHILSFLHDVDKNRNEAVKYQWQWNVSNCLFSTQVSKMLSFDINIEKVFTNTMKKNRKMSTNQGDLTYFSWKIIQNLSKMITKPKMRLKLRYLNLILWSTKKSSLRMRRTLKWQSSFSSRMKPWLDSYW